MVLNALNHASGQSNAEIFTCFIDRPPRHKNKSAIPNIRLH
jgi:hypothetical protein